MENYTTMQCFILEWRLEQRFITTFIRQLRECIQFSIKFMREFWLLNKTSKMDYVLMKTLWINIERITKFPTHRGEKFFPHLLMQKHKRYLFIFFDLMSFTTICEIFFLEFVRMSSISKELLMVFGLHA